MFTLVEEKVSLLMTVNDPIEVQRRYLRHKLADPVTTFEFFEHLYHHAQDRYLEYLLSEQYEPTWLGPYMRKVFFDIETLYWTNAKELHALYPTGSTNYFSKIRVGFAASMDDQGYVSFWREAQVSEFIDYLLLDFGHFEGRKVGGVVVTPVRASATASQLARMPPASILPRGGVIPAIS
jgi:hypothetical protein